MLQPTVTKPGARTIKLHPRACVDPTRWVWPLPAIEDAIPRVLTHTNDERHAIEVGYGDSGGVSSLVPVYAVHEGTIRLARARVKASADLLGLRVVRADLEDGFDHCDPPVQNGTSSSIGCPMRLSRGLR